MSENPHAADQEVLSALLSETGDIQIIPRYDERDIGHPNCLVVAPYRDSANGTTIMATVEHYFENKESAGFPWKILQVTEEPLTLQAAVDAALRYAVDNNVFVIFLNQDGFSTDAEKQQTNTIVIKRPTMADGTS